MQKLNSFKSSFSNFPDRGARLHLWLERFEFGLFLFGVIMGCKFCTDKDGNCCYPYYGLGPHKHDLSKTGSFIGSTVFIDEPTPKNFSPDSDGSGAGVYTHCLKCGAANK
jgi:hypothetical protein